MQLPKNERRDISTVTKRKIWLYGAPFSGKTTFANAFPDPLLLNTDGNVQFVDAPYIHLKDVVTGDRLVKRTFAWEIFKDAITELEKKDNDFKTIVVDLLEDLYESCRRYICDQKGWDHESDDSFKAYDIVRTEFLTIIKRLMNLDYDNIVLISHVDMSKDIMKKGGDKITAIRPNLNEKIANKVSGMVDIVARTIADDGNYILSFKRNEVIFGGGRLKFKATEIPLDYKAFCDLYAEANQNVVSSAQNVPSEATNTTKEVPSEEVQPEPVNQTESAQDPVGNEPVRRRKRRTE